MFLYGLWANMVNMVMPELLHKKLGPNWEYFNI